MPDPMPDPTNSPSGYPLETDLVRRLEGMQIDPERIKALQDAGTLEDALAQAIGEWEGAVGWTPYVADADDSIRLFDPPTRVMGAGRRVPGTRRLELRAGLVSFTSLAILDSDLVPGVDFYLLPNGAPSGLQPITAVEFLMPQYGLPQTIAITGRWGKVAAVPADVRSALLQYALSIAAPDLSMAISGGFTERRTGDSIKKFAGTGSNGPLDLQMQKWPAGFQRLVRREKRLTL